MTLRTIANTPFKKLILSGVGALAIGAAAIALPDTTYAQAPRLMTPPTGFGGQMSFADLVEQVSPAVVSIHTEKTIEQPEIPSEFQWFFERQFGEDFEERFGEERQAAAEGSGFFVDGDGHIVTNNHVIDGAETITIRLNDGSELDAVLLGTDAATDIAVLKVDAPNNQPFVTFADNVNLRVGDWVLAVGNPFGLGGTVTSGIVSAIGRDNGMGVYNDFIQIDAPINRGNSGGPTFDLNGRVVGVNNAIYSPTGGSVGIGFAIPAQTASFVVDQLIEKGTVTRGWLGVEIRPFDNNHAAAVGLDSDDGALVVNVQSGTPAAKAGIESGDIVLDFNGTKVDNARTLTRAVGAVAPGETAKLTVWRNGEQKNLRVKLGERNEEQLAEADIPSDDGASPTPEITSELGVRFSALTDQARQQYDLPAELRGALVTSVAPNSPAAQAGLQRGMVIYEIDNDAVSSPSDVESKIKSLQDSGKEAVLLRVQAGDRKDFRALPLKKS
ncbi:DegQ family serine endoprotease [Parvularcula flava]|uniref:DegQ family serine endoprotease n=1 Tax=Aquisalinus luteolus TaxID=1566827 RepID=A0A8J3EQA2_9PROT|nr:DegQ family serine endoprotease [Aquisalinus luteolus]NHK29594.1 DegQ family serine endoprotease [Aquisalinus luteolus]GGI01468.1 serine peptidase [Aquisalinus luteolus]